MVGNFLCARLIHHYKTAAGYNWNAIWGITTLVSVGLLLGFALLFREDGNLRKSAGKRKPYN
jgi:hypothetical protein